MQKPLTDQRKGFAAKTFYKRIVPQTTYTNQESRISELSNYIHCHRLTDALEILAESGIKGDLALFIIANLQQMEVAA